DRKRGSHGGGRPARRRAAVATGLRQVAQAGGGRRPVGHLGVGGGAATAGPAPPLSAGEAEPEEPRGIDDSARRKKEIARWATPGPDRRRVPVRASYSLLA